ncbi:transcriptional regulator [Gordoniibacillus kamchatkensis]|uniref:Transcriptional regulator n=2 Tax=Gordoniibacillus kamchatkensis TaxID=1590651 RepID=A0ABR5ADH3_9BACL|nr:transcriptional regulator [Paenibacillus sp. VKM B-2647]
MEQGPERSTRQVILTLIKTRGERSVAELAKQLGVTEMAVRRHLNVMERDGLVRTKLVRQAMGRPTNVYSLSDEADELFPKNYHQLALDLLEELDTTEVEALFAKRQRKLYERYRERMQGKTLPERVQELAGIQNASGYMAHWRETEPGLYELSEHNCPISQVAAPYQEACSCELALFRQLLEAEVERTECLAKGGGKCVYRIQDIG